MEEVVICRTATSEFLEVQLQLNNIPVPAVIDTAAEVTLVSDKIYERMDPKPPILRHVILRTASRDSEPMQGFVVGPVQISLGSKTFLEYVYVGPLCDSVLLGLDFLYKHKVNVEMDPSCLRLHNEIIPMHLTSRKEAPKVARVSVAKRTVIPPHAARYVKCDLSNSLSSSVFCIEPDTTSKVMCPRSIHQSGKDLYVYMLNVSDSHVTVKRSAEVGVAGEMDSFLEESKSSPAEGETCSSPEDGECLPAEGETHSSLEDSESLPAEGETCSSPEDGEEGKEGIQGNCDKADIPLCLKEMFEKSCVNLSDSERLQFRELLNEYQDVFAKSEFDLGNFTEIEHSIDTGDAPPVKLKMRRTPACFVNEEEAHLQKMLDAGVIEPSTSEWASAPVLIRKRDKSVRWCLDFRKLNDVTVKDVYPLPLVDECLDTLVGNAWFSKLDANSAYWQIDIKEEDRKKTAFLTKYGSYQFRKMAFGLTGAPSTFSRAINLVLRGLTWKMVLAFLDDVMVLGSSFEDHMHNLRLVFSRFRQYGLRLKAKKCLFFQKQVEFLGRLVSEDGIEVGPEPTQVVREWPVPTCVKEVQSFLGLVNYHRNFMKDFAEKAVPLYNVTKKGGFHWGSEQQEAFDALKQVLCSAPVLSFPNSHDMFILDTDASGQALGAELLQLQDGQEKVIAYASCALTKEQTRYCTTRQELLAIIKFTRQFRHYLLGRRFLLRTDHSSLAWLLNFKEPQGQLARWLEEMSQFDMLVKHRPGRSHANADALSRIPQPDACGEYNFHIPLECLPCGGCHYCARAQQNWDQFFEEVDDVIPLASGSIEFDPRKELVVNNVRLGDSDWSSELMDDCVYLMDLEERSEGADLKERSVQFVSKFEVSDEIQKDEDLALLLKSLKKWHRSFRRRVVPG